MRYFSKTRTGTQCQNQLQKKIRDYIHHHPTKRPLEPNADTIGGHHPFGHKNTGSEQAGGTAGRSRKNNSLFSQNI